MRLLSLYLPMTAVVALTAVLLTVHVTVAVAAAAVGNPIAAVWQEHQVKFFYLGRTSRYSCEGLRAKVRAMLLDLGARRDLKLTAMGCEDTGRERRAAPTASLHLVFSTPALPDPAVKPSHDGDLTAVDARFEPFILTGDAFRNMGVGDCELVEAFARQILPKLTLHNLQREISCVPLQAGGSRFWIRGEILRPLPPAEQSAQRHRLKVP